MRPIRLDSSREGLGLDRRAFLRGLAGSACCAGPAMQAAGGDREADKPPLIDTHMHVWADDVERFPFAHPYEPKFKLPKTPGTAEVLLKEMDAFGVTHCVLVQVIYHGWDNRYVAHCLKAHPKRFRVQGLIDPTDPKVAEKLEFWVKKHGLSGMRFSPIYYEGKDGWLNARATNALWEKAEELKAIFNFFIATAQLTRLEEMIRRFPKVRVVIDHLARIDLKAADPLPEFKKLLALAKHPNVWAKLSELCIISPSEKYPYKDTHEWVKRLYEAFGPDRLMWGTGFPGATREEAGRPSLRQELDLVNKEIGFFTAADKEKILGRNAAKLWGFEALVRP